MSSRKKLREFCAYFSHSDATLPNVTAHECLRYIEAFGQRYKDGHYSKGHDSLSACTVEMVLLHVGMLFSNMDLQDPRLQPGSGTYVPSYKKWLVSLHKTDTAPGRTFPCSLAILKALYITGQNTRDTHATDLATIGYFFLNQPGEVIRTPSADTG